MPVQNLVDILQENLNNPQYRRIFLQIACDEFDEEKDIQAFCKALDDVKQAALQNAHEFA